MGEHINKNPKRAASTEANITKFYNYIKNYIRENGFPPSVREMCVVMNNCSTSTVFYYLLKLEKMKLINRRFNKNRAIEVPELQLEAQQLANKSAKGTVAIPLVGTIAAGTPILAEQNLEETFVISDNLFKRGELFMLTVKGESMINASIKSGDRVIVRTQNTANNGEIAAVMIDGEATVKRFYKEKGQIRLKPENDNMSDIIIRNADILGVVVGLIRQY